MKTQISFLFVLSWISVAVVHAAQPQSPGNDISTRVFNSADITVSQLKPGEWQSLTFDSDAIPPISMRPQPIPAG